ncbi:MAG: hypothetical protein U0797_05535 [Gemmataceae bacterium]
MSEPWFEVVSADRPLTQGDLILACPVLSWAVGGEGGPAEEAERLKGMVQVMQADVVVLTQACDLEHSKVSSVVLCPCHTLPALKAAWEEQMSQRRQTPTEKAWKRYCDDVAAGYVWNQSLLNSFSGDLTTEIRVADFLQVFTIPRAVLEDLLRRRDRPRLRLRPPYREHLSQAFARFFMRVGLPTPVEKTW